MFQIKGRVAELGIDIPRYTKTLDNAISTQVRQAARAWLRAVIIRVPVWTGTSRGSLQPLGAFLRVAVPIKPIASRRGYGVSIGASKSEFQFGRRGTVWFFEFTEEVAHYLVNEYFNVNGTGKFNLTNPGPYKSFSAGETAFESYIETNLQSRLPKPEDFQTTTFIKFQGK